MKGRIASFALLLSWIASATAPAAADDLTYLVHAPTSPSAHPPVILLLHGAGADERDMIGLWSQLPGPFVVVSPRAPFRDPGGGYEWYRKSGRAADIAVSRKIIDLLVESAVQRFDADPKRVFLAGFSQGAVMVYEVALREPDRFAGAAVLSGTLFSPALARTDEPHTAFFIAHGTADPRIAFANATAARAALARAGVPTAFHAYSGMHHEISDTETRDLSAWLSERLSPDQGDTAR